MRCGCCGLKTDWLKIISWVDNDIEYDLFCHKCYMWALSADDFPGLFQFEWRKLYAAKR